MNENSGGTPNPLNPSPLDANPSEPIEEVHQEPVQEKPVSVNPVEPVPAPEPTPEPIPEPELKPLTEELVQESVMVNSLDPEGRPMEKAAETTAVEPKKKKTSLIVGLVICLFIAVGCGVAAILMMMNTAKDPVSAAIEKLMNGDVPANLGINGTIEILANDTASQISKATVTLDSQLKTGSMINASTAEVDLVMADASEMSFKVSEIYADSQDLYLKVEKKDQIVLENEQLLDETNCIGDESGETNCLVDTETVTEEESSLVLDDLTSILDGVIEMINGQWIRIAMSTADQMSGGISVDSDVSCLINAAKDMNANSNSLAEFYNKNPFIGSATENIPVNSKLNQLRQVTVDEEKFVSFVNSIQNTSLVDMVNECLGSEEGTTITTDDVVSAVGQLPAIYVEVNSDNTFSRLYTKALSEDQKYVFTVDLSFTYPTNINVSEPTEYTDLETLMQGMMGYDELDEDTEVVEEEEEVEE